MVNYLSKGRMRGAYVLAIGVTCPVKIEVGRLGVLSFSPGAYAYVGSALGGIEARVSRHLRREKKLHWHIDYLLGSQAARVITVYAKETSVRWEYQVARALAEECQVIPGFGASDFRCRGHLFRCPPQRLAQTLARLGFHELPMEPASPRQPLDEPDSPS